MKTAKTSRTTQDAVSVVHEVLGLSYGLLITVFLYVTYPIK